MKKQGGLQFGLNIKSDIPSHKSYPDTKKMIGDDHILNDSESEEEGLEGLDTNFLQDVMKDDEKFMNMLIKINDKAVHDIQAGNLKEALNMLERMEKILEYAAINKKILDRNLVIVCLYNIACTHQALWVLDKCSKYIDGVIYNLDQSLKQDESLLKEAIANKADPTQRNALRAIKLRKLQFLLRVYLQHCAVLSQLSKHDEALVFAKRSQKAMTSIINECADCCREAQKKVELPSTAQTSVSTQEEGRNSETMSRSGGMMDTKRILDNSSIFRDEVSYLKNILDYAVPFINDLIDTIGGFSVHKSQEILKQTRKSLFNWKNNPENNEKYLRKEFGKSKLPAELKDKNRSLLGVQRPVEWLENLNIGTIMHMKPLRYKDYAQKKEFTNDITKDSLQEKVIFQSLIYFTIATEMRFIEMSDEKSNKQGETKATQEEIRMREQYKNSEAYHLKAIELACRYICKACPYVNHLISSYQKHYNQDLETIPEESYYSASEGITTQEASREYGRKAFKLLEQVDEADEPVLSPAIKIETGLLKKINTSRPNKDKPKTAEDRVRKPISDQLREERINLSNQLRQSGTERIPLKREMEEVTRKKDHSEEIESKGRKSAKPKRKFTEEDEAKNVFVANLSVGSLALENLLSHSITPSNPKTTTSQSKTRDSVKRGRHNEDDGSASKYFMKKHYDIPNLNLGKMPPQAHVKTHIMPDKHLVEQPEPGFMSERNIKRTDIHSKKVDTNSISPKKMRKDQNDPAINLFFYKNFNKFIQNLYVQDEQGGKKPRLDLKKDSKLANNPYSKEIIAITKKSSHGKRNLVPQTVKSRPSQTQNNSESKKISLSFMRSSTKEKDEIFQKVHDTSPRLYTSPKDSDIFKKDIEDKDSKIGKLVKSVSYKNVPVLDLGKVKAGKEKIKHISPRH